AHIFFVMAALDVKGLRAQLSSALLLGVGSLHWTILGTTAVVIGYLLMLRFAVPLLLMFGIGLPAVVFAAICARTLRDLEPAPDQAADSTLRTQAHPAERTDALSRRSTSAPTERTPSGKEFRHDQPQNSALFRPCRCSRRARALRMRWQRRRLRRLERR